eukprot:TRINITY_DN28050_c0_g1_i2.p1 TRINITY_DN28050_c0_g1~~TRINITY_DN28050_c0_g1_i2.p1  ORF type:complete len:132 (+),score=17.64 TRINITY_DN28050_c0_g1_i2:46-441(+)
MRPTRMNAPLPNLGFAEHLGDRDKFTLESALYGIRTAPTIFALLLGVVFGTLRALCWKWTEIGFFLGPLVILWALMINWYSNNYGSCCPMCASNYDPIKEDAEGFTSASESEFSTVRDVKFPRELFQKEES